MNTKWMAGLLLAPLVGIAYSPLVAAQNLDVAVVVNPSNTRAKVTQAELRKIFAGEKRSWPGGLPIKLIVRAPGCHERLVLLRLLGMSETEYKQYWISQILRGEAAHEPVAVFSNGMQKEAVTAMPGAIALMEAQDVKATTRVLQVDGFLPGTAGYPLH